MDKKKRNRLIILGAVVFVLFMVIAKKAGWIGAEGKVEVTTEKAESRTIVETVSASGKVQPEVEVKISPDVSGEIVELFVKEGQQVKKGDLLCRINPDIYVSMQDRMAATVNSRNPARHFAAIIAWLAGSRLKSSLPSPMTIWLL